MLVSEPLWVLVSSSTLSWSAWAAVTKYYRLGSLNHRHLFLTFWRQISSRLRCWQSQFLVRSVPLACR